MTEILYKLEKKEKKKSVVNFGESFMYIHTHVAYVYMCTCLQVPFCVWGYKQTHFRDVKVNFSEE